jgi:hypothetical protein
MHNNQKEYVQAWNSTKYIMSLLLNKLFFENLSNSKENLGTITSLNQINNVIIKIIVWQFPALFPKNYSSHLEILNK